MSGGARKLVVDCDPGTDDAQAILMALATPSVDVVAVTTTFGNGTIDNTSWNALRTLTVADRLDIPVYKGCANSLSGLPPSGDGFHGIDSLGDVPHLFPGDVSLLQPQHSSIALLELAKKHKGDLTLMVLGPLTNVAVALHLDPSFGQNIKELVIMGGNTTGKGNITKTAEFNFYSDPEAAEKVLRDYTGPMTLVPMELCEDFSFPWDWYAKYISQTTKKGEFVRETDKEMVKSSQRVNASVYWTWDQLAMATFLNEKVVKETKRAKVSVELHEEAKRGMMKVDWDSEGANVTVVTDVDQKVFEQEIYKAVL